MNLDLRQIDRVENISKADFLKKYYKPQIPVVIENGITDWPAYNKWSLDYIRSLAGDKTVPLQDSRPIEASRQINEPHAHMKLSEYVDLLKQQPTNYRIFLWNILKEVPELQNDFEYPDFGIRLIKSLPMLFFGGADSYTFMHYDIDLANIFHYHFEGRKKIILFDQKQNKYMYKVPYALIPREDIDFNNPDLDKWPALKNAQGYVTELEHGNMLYMPEGYWHYMRYLTPGFSMSLRAVARNPINFSRAVYNVFIMRNLDNALRKYRGQKWIDWKNEQAIIRTNRINGITA